MALLLWKGDAFPLGIAIARSYTRKAFFGVPRVSLFPDSPFSPRERPQQLLSTARRGLYLVDIAERREVG